MGKKALVTGACGFTGSHMLELLSENGWDIVATDLEGSQREVYYSEEGDATPVFYEDIMDEADAEFIPADLTDKESLKPLFDGHDYDVIFHIASLYDYFAEMEELRKVNVEGGRNIAELAIENDVPHFIHWSTEGVLGDAGFDEPKTEDAEYHAHNRYCKSKVEQEEMLWDLHENEGLPLTIVRPAPIYGPRHTYGVYHVLMTIRKMGKGLIPRIYPRSKQLKFPSIHVKDLVRAALFLHLNKDESIGEAYNVVSDEIGQDELMEFLAHNLPVEETVRVPIWFPVFKGLAWVSQKLATWNEKRARKKGKRPKIDASMTQYLTGNMWFSNQKLKDLGFEFVYQDPRRGLLDYITWCKEQGMI